MRIRFTKIKRTRETGDYQKGTWFVGVLDGLRDDVIEGDATEEPQVGKRFEFTAEPRDVESGMRLVTTSPLVDVTETEGGWLVLTESGSIYSIVIVPALPVDHGASEAMDRLFAEQWEQYDDAYIADPTKE